MIAGGIGAQDLGAAGGVDVLRARRDPAIPEELDDLEDFRPAWEGAVVDPLVLVDGHDELEEFAGEFAFFRGLSDFTAAPSWTAAPVQPGSAVDGGPSIARLSAALRTDVLLAHGA